MSLDLGTLTVKLAADVAGLKADLAKANVEAKRSSDSMKSAFHSMVGAFEGPVGALEGFGKSVKKITKGIKEMFGDEATAQGQRWGKEIQSALGLSDEQVKALGQSMKGLQGLAHVVGQSFGLIKEGVMWLAAGGAVALAAFAAALIGVLAVIGAVQRNMGNLKLFWEDLWRDNSGFEGFLDKMVDRWAKAAKSFLTILKAIENATNMGGASEAGNIMSAQPGFAGTAMDTRSDTRKILDQATQSVEAIRDALGSAAARAETGAKIGDAAGRIKDAFVADAKQVFGDVWKDIEAGAKAVGLDKIPGILKGFGEAGTSKGELDKAAKEAEDLAIRQQAWLKLAAEEKAEWEKYTNKAAAEEVKRTEAWINTQNKELEEFKQHQEQESKISVDNIASGRFIGASKDGKAVAGGATSGIGGAINSFTGAIVQGSKNLSATMQGFAQGFQNGGVIGGILGAIMALLTQSKGFSTILNVIDTLLQVISDALGGLFTALGPLLLCVMPLVQILAQFITPIFSALGASLQAIYPLIQGLNWIAGKFMQGLAFVMNTLLDVVLWIFGKIRPVFDFFAGVVTGICNAFINVINGVIGGISGFVWTIGDLISKIPLMGDVGKGIKNFANQINSWKMDKATNDWSKGVDGLIDGVVEKLKAIVTGAKIDSGAIQGQIAGITSDTWDALKKKMEDQQAALDDQTNATTKAAASAKSFSESLTNIPTGYRVAAAAFNAQTPSLPHFAAGGFVSSPTVAVVGDSPGGEYIVPAAQAGGITINVSGAGSPETVASLVLAKLKALGFGSRGSTQQLAPQYTGS